MLSTEELLQSIEEKINQSPLPAAIVFNSHITGLAVARSLGKHGVPIIALDRDANGYAFASKYVTASALCPNVLQDEEGFIAFLLTIGHHLKQRGILFPCNDEWVLAVNRHRERLAEYFTFPFSDSTIVEPILDKAQLYQTATALQIPIPRTWNLQTEPLAQVAQELPYPCIVKPTEQRSFYDVFRDKAWRIESADELRAAVERAHGHALVAQEIVGESLTDFYSVCSYIGQDGQAHGVFVGRKLEQYPPNFGTGCLVVSEQVQSIAERGVRMLQEFGYRGISEIEFIYDAHDGEHKLLDINTRVWKWIGLPIAAGVDLPWLAYADSIGQPTHAEEPANEIVWTYARDYFALRTEGHGRGTVHYLPEALWAEFVAGKSEHIVDAVINTDDPTPAARMLSTLFGRNTYFCAC